jgi:CBS domain-containing protein
MMTVVTVKRLLEEKGNQIWSISPEASVYSALQLMADKRIGALLVLDQGKLVGVISERDYARKIVLLGKTSRETTVREIMSTKVYFVRPGQRIDECMAIMTQKTVRHLPVMEGEALVGIISIGDVVKTIISEQQFIIEQLEQFITGR